MKRRVLAKVVLLFYIVSFGFSPAAQAQTRTQATPSPANIELPTESLPTGVNLTLSPTFLNLTTDPGKNIVSQFRVTNNNNFRDYLEIQIKKFAGSDEGTGPVIQDPQPQDDFMQWVSFSETQFMLDPNQTKTIRFTISPPPEAALGYYYAFVVNRIRNANTQDSAAIVGAPALPVLLSVKSPNAMREVQVEDFKTDKLVYEELPATFLIKVKNTGNIHVAPAGDIFIDSMFSDEVGTLPANKGRGNVLPSSTRTYTTSWDDGFLSRVPKVIDGKPQLDKDGNTIYTTKYDFSKADKFRIGKYTATLIMVYDNGERDVPVEARVSFWIIPWKILAVILLIVVLMLFGLKAAIWNPMRKMMRK